MGNKRERKRKSDRTRDDSLHNEKQRLKYHEKKKQTSTNIEEIPDDDATRDLDHNADDMNVKIEFKKKLNEVCINIVNLLKIQ